MFKSEKEFIHWLRDYAPATGRSLRLGIGDDTALIAASPGCDILLKADLSVEGVHFDREFHPPRAIGHRALARSLSDVAAMGGVPRFALISLAIPRGTRTEWLNELLRGVFELAARFRVAIVGGDTSIVPGRAALDAIIVGEIPKGRAIRRSGARPGDLIYVSGVLGYSALGFEILRSGGRTKPSPQSARRRDRRTADVDQAALEAHLYPKPRLALGRFLREKRLSTALIDVSDGLSSDLARLCEASGTGAVLWASAIPAPETAGRSQEGQDNPRSQGRRLDLALHGGEDYELLFTVRPDRAAKLPGKVGRVPLHRIGEVRGEAGVRIVDSHGKEASLKPRGWDHFKPKGGL